MVLSLKITSCKNIINYRIGCYAKHGRMVTNSPRNKNVQWLGAVQTEKLPKNRKISLRCKNIVDGEVRVFIDGVETLVAEEYSACVSVTLPVETGKTYRVEVKYEEPTFEKKLISHALRVLTGAEGPNEKKFNLYAEFVKAPSLANYEKLVESAPITENAKIRMKEIL